MLEPCSAESQQNPNELVQGESRESAQEDRLGEQERDTRCAWTGRNHLTPAHLQGRALLTADSGDVEEGEVKAALATENRDHGSLALCSRFTFMSFWLSRVVLEPHLGLVNRHLRIRVLWGKSRVDTVHGKERREDERGPVSPSEGAFCRLCL